MLLFLLHLITFILHWSLSSFYCFYRINCSTDCWMMNIINAEMTAAPCLYLYNSHYSCLLRGMFLFLPQDDDDDPGMLHVVHLGMV